MVCSMCYGDTSKVAAILRNNICDYLWNQKGGPKKNALFCFSFQSRVLQIFFPHFSGGVGSRPGRFF